MPSTLDIVASPKTSDINIKSIEVWNISTENCSNHWIVNFDHNSGGNTSASILEREDPVDWTHGVSIEGSIIKSFPVNYGCLGIQQLATCIFVPEHLSIPRMLRCRCSDWM